MKKLILSLISLLIVSQSQAQQYWKIDSVGNSITWHIKKGEVHHDHIEMAGKQVAAVLRYGVNKDGSFELNKSMIWPMLRILPNNTHGSLMRRYDWNPLDASTVNGRSIREQVKTITLNGTMEVVSEINLGKDNSLSLKRIYFPSVDLPSLIEIYEFTNTGEKNVTLELAHEHNQINTNKETGVDGSYQIHMNALGDNITLSPGQTYLYSASITGCKTSDNGPAVYWQEP